ncbi:GyrI-like domain-containing protein, partial [Myxococcota bacterium]|nr:GyrI-like domain-containing protein [Myxococcota bacterium]
TGLKATYTKAMEYMKKEGLTSLGVSCEIYLNNPMTTKPADLKTEVFMPVK